MILDLPFKWRVYIERVGWSHLTPKRFFRVALSKFGLYTNIGPYIFDVYRRLR